MAEKLSAEDILDKEIDYLLFKADLISHRDDFMRLGVSKVKHFLDIEDEDLEEDIKLSKIEARRLKRHFSEIQEEARKTHISTGVNVSSIKSTPKRQAVLSWGPNKLKISKGESTEVIKEPWEKYIVPNPHSRKLRFYNSIVKQVYESAQRFKQSGFKQYLLDQQQMRWKLNNQIEELAKKHQNLLKNEKWGVCQNIQKYMTGPNGCNSEDVNKCEASLEAINKALETANKHVAFIENIIKTLYKEDHSLKLYATDELGYFENVRLQVNAIKDELIQASALLTTTLLELQRRFPHPATAASTAKKSRRKKENKRKNKKKKKQRLEKRAFKLLVRLTSKTTAEILFQQTREGCQNYTIVTSLTADSTANLSRRQHLDPLQWLLQRQFFSETVASGLSEVAAILEASDVKESDDGLSSELSESDIVNVDDDDDDDVSKP